MKNQIIQFRDSLKVSKLFVLVFAAFIWPSSIVSQDIQWQKTLGGSEQDFMYWGIVATADSGCLVGGTSNSPVSGVKTIGIRGFLDYWIIKLDSVGSIEWQKVIGGHADDFLWALHSTSDGGYIVGGYSQSNAGFEKTENCIGNHDYWILKLDAAGNILWQNTIGGNDADWFKAINETDDGGYIVGGSSLSGISGDKTESSYGDFDYWVLKLDSIGNIEWQKTIGGTGGDRLYDVQQTADGGYIASGTSGSGISGNKTVNTYGGNDYWIVKMDQAGTIQWQKSYGGTGNEDCLKMIKTSDGGLMLNGSSSSLISGIVTENAHNSSPDFWILKIDSIGNVEWQSMLGGFILDSAYDIKQTDDGGYIVAGASDSGMDGDKTEPLLGVQDGWIAKFDSSGVIEWQNTIGGDQYEYMWAVSLATTGDGFFLGGISSSGISGDKTEAGYGDGDIWIIKMSNKYNSIRGSVFADLNLNNMKDSSESFIPHHKINETLTGNFTFSHSGGLYYRTVEGPGNYFVAPDSLNFYSFTPTTHSAFFTNYYQIDSLNDFAFQPSGVFNDLCVTITPMGQFRAGFNGYFHINYENLGTTTINPSIIFYTDADVSFVSATPNANMITPDSVVWNFGPLAPFQTGNILVTLNVTIGTPIGTLINSGAVIEPLAGDANTGCNYSNWDVFTTGSMDPNDILVDQDTLLSTQFPNPPYLEYIIRFQNTGNDTAFTAKVLNPIDTMKLDLSSFEFITSSHPVSLNWVSWERNMEFLFENILLPDSNINEPASHGFVRYRIKPKSTLTAGDSITNYAAIYFDFNLPVITNTAITRIVLPTFINEIALKGHMRLYPNPANSTLSIETENLPDSENRLIVLDVTGRTMFSKSLSSTSTKNDLDISFLSRGVYFVQLQTGGKISMGKFIKN